MIAFSKRVAVSAFALAGPAVLASAAGAAVVSVPASKDAMIFATSAGVDTNNASGRGPALFAGADGSSNRKRSMIQFDIASAGIPADATVTGVTLTMYLGQVAGSGGGSPGGGSYPSRTFRLYRLEQDWGEGTSGSPTSASIGGTGQGYARVPGDSTWNYALYDPDPANAVLWAGAGAGGNVAASQSGEATFASPFTTGSAYSWDSAGAASAGMVADVQGWLDGSVPNFGWQLRSDLESSPTSFLGFWSRDGAAANTAAGSDAPVLNITYVPEPAGSAVLAAAAAFGALFRGRRRHREGACTT